MSGTLRHRARALSAALAGTVLLVLPACSSDDDGPSGGSSGQPDRTGVRVLLDWFPNPDHVGLYTAEEKGFFADEGLDVDLTPPSNPADTLKLVSTGKVPLGISYEPDTIIAKAQGLDVTAVAAVIPVALNSLMATDDSSLDSARDLAGKTIGTPGLPSDDVYLQQMYREYDVDPDSVKTVNVGTNLVASMLSGKVDATVGGYRNIEGVQLADRGKDPVVVPVTDAGVPDYDELVVVADASRLKSDDGYRDTVRRFLRALAKGTETAVRQPDAAVEAVRPVTKGYSAPLVRKMTAATVPLLDNPLGFGRMDVADWQSFADWMHENELVDKRVDAAGVVTNDHLPK